VNSVVLSRALALRKTGRFLTAFGFLPLQVRRVKRSVSVGLFGRRGFVAGRGSTLSWLGSLAVAALALVLRRFCRVR
jgi:hypothetical protein